MDSGPICSSYYCGSRCLMFVLNVAANRISVGYDKVTECHR